MYGGENSGMPLGPDPVNNGTGTFGADDNYDQPAAIVSGGDDGGAVAFDSGNNKSNNNSAKFFGRRSRESATRADAAQAQANAELAAASSIASNPNNPEFFRQAAVDNTTSKIQRQPRQINKKPFIVGGVVLIIIAVAIAAISFFPKYIANLHTGDLEKVQAEAVEINDDLAFYESRIDFITKASSININTFRISSEALEEYKSASQERLSKIDSFSNNIKGYSIEGDYAEYLNYLKEKLPARVEIYKKYDQLYIGMAEAMQGGSDDVEGKISFASSYDGYADIVKVIKTGIDSKSEIDKKWKEWNCGPNSKGEIPEKCEQLLDQSEYVSSYFAKNGDITNFMKSAFKDVMIDDYINECVSKLSDEKIKEATSNEEE